jgi:RND family efflux transporter MFP subunit
MTRKLEQLVVLVGLSLVAGCARSVAQNEPPPAVQVVVTTPIKKQIVEWDEYVARVDAVDFVEVRARVSGYLQSIHFDEGQIVKEGDLLFVIDPRPFVAERNRAQADLEQAAARVAQAKEQLVQATAEERRVAAGLDYAQQRFGRSKKLVAKAAVTQDEFELHESQLRQAQADLNAARAQIELSRAAIGTAEAAVETAQAAVGIADLNLQYTRLLAPITGRISRREVTEGNLINGGTVQSTLLTTIVSLDPIHVYFDADEQAFLKYTRLAMEGKRQSSREVKNPVYIALADERRGYPHQGHMDFVDNRLDPNTGTMRGRAIFRNADLALTPGLFARLRLPGSAPYEAVLAPDSAIGSDQSVKYVLIVDAENKVRRQPVEIGPMSHGLRVVRSGLDGSERIVLRGLQRVRPGVQVTPIVEEIKPHRDSGLPDSYTPVPEEEWIALKQKPSSELQPVSFQSISDPQRRRDAEVNQSQRTETRRPGG